MDGSNSQPMLRVVRLGIALRDLAATTPPSGPRAISRITTEIERIPRMIQKDSRQMLRVVRFGK